MILSKPSEKFILAKYPAGSILQWFGENKELYMQRLGISGHNGWDYFTGYGDPILAGEKAAVVDVKYSPEGYGRHVRVLTWDKEDGCFLEITYGHCSDVSVKLGDIVERGQKIALQGNSGVVFCQNNQFWGDSDPNKCGTHCHITIRQLENANGRDGIQWLGKWYYVRNYDNGFKGAVDPAPYFEFSVPTSLNHNFAMNLFLRCEMLGGAYKAEVTNLQIALLLDGEFPKEKLTAENMGYFGTMTLRAVQDFQTKYSINPIFGFVGPKTRAILNKIFG